MQGRLTEAELSHHASLRDAAARQLPGGQFPLSSRGSVFRSCLSAPEQPACLSLLPLVRKALNFCSSAQDKATLLHNVHDAAAGLPTFVPRICFFVSAFMHACICVCVKKLNGCSC